MSYYRLQLWAKRLEIITVDQFGYLQNELSVSSSELWDQLMTLEELKIVKRYSFPDKVGWIYYPEDAKKEFQKIVLDWLMEEGSGSLTDVADGTNLNERVTLWALSDLIEDHKVFKNNLTYRVAFGENDKDVVKNVLMESGLSLKKAALGRLTGIRGKQLEDVLNWYVVKGKVEEFRGKYRWRLDALEPKLN